MKEKTAVDWFYEQTVVQGKTNYAELLEQAKQLFRQQIEEAYKKGCRDTYGNDEPNFLDPNDEKSASDYFTEKYK